MGLLGRLLTTCSHALRQPSRATLQHAIAQRTSTCGNRSFATALFRTLATSKTSAIDTAASSRKAGSVVQGWFHQFKPAGRVQAPYHHQTRGLFAATPKHKKPPKNWQNHNPKPPHVGRKIKTPSVAKRRFYVAENGVIMRRHTHNRHNKAKRSKRALRALKGDVPLAKGYAKKLKKLGFKRKFWYHRKMG